MADFTGTNGNDNLTGTGEADNFYPLLGSDAVDGLGGSDTLYVDYSNYFYDPYAGASGPGPEKSSVVTSSGGSFSGIVRSTYGWPAVTLTSIEHLRIKFDYLNNTFLLDAAALAGGATVAIDGGAGNFDRLEVD